MQSVSIVGCGYTGRRLAQRWLNAQCRVLGFATSDQSLRQILAVGAEARALNLDEPPPLLDLEGHLVYYAVPPPAAGERDLRFERMLANVVGRPQRIVYFSTTGIYGDRGGGAVDEDAVPSPATGRARRRLAAETLLRQWADSHAVPWCILRIPGIYGPGRLPLERLRRLQPAIDPLEATPSNRIHVDDLVTACVAAGSTARADGRVYNITDGSEDSLTSYLLRVARIVDLPAPPLISRAEAHRTFSAMSWSFLGESRRVINRRMREELGVDLAYSDLDAGIRASL